VGTRETLANVLVSVADTGLGMDEDTRRRVFEPFFTTKMDVGTGLGLFTVHGTVKRWEGWITVESIPGTGTTFLIEIPKWTEESEPEKSETTHRVNVRRMEILVIDDEVVVRDAAHLLLSKNHGVTTKSSGLDAIKTFSAARHQIALIDLGLPGIPGDVISLVTIMVTGWLLDENDPRLESFDFLLQKPFSRESLLDIITKAAQLRMSRLQGEVASTADHPADPDLA
jgi:two-component system cell cycle sensor histidine kinase/response regulator CckA